MSSAGCELQGLTSDYILGLVSRKVLRHQPRNRPIVIMTSEPLRSETSIEDLRRNLGALSRTHIGQRVQRK
jgi:hypothetical protein